MPRLNEINNAKKQIIEIGNKLWQRNYVASNDGNISIKLSDNTILTTPTGVSKSDMTPEMIIQTDLDGNILENSSKYYPSSELKMHLTVYRQRPDVKAVVHAHPVFATTFAIIGKPLIENILPEAVIQLGIVPIAQYGTPSTNQIPLSIIPHLQTSDAILLQNHGCITVGIDLKTAYYKLETLEHYCQILHQSKLLGEYRELSEPQMNELIELRKQMQMSGRVLIQNKSRMIQF